MDIIYTYIICMFLLIVFWYYNLAPQEKFVILRPNQYWP